MRERSDFLFFVFLFFYLLFLYLLFLCGYFSTPLYLFFWACQHLFYLLFYVMFPSLDLALVPTVDPSPTAPMVAERLSCQSCTLSAVTSDGC